MRNICKLQMSVNLTELFLLIAANFENMMAKSRLSSMLKTSLASIVKISNMLETKILLLLYRDV